MIETEDCLQKLTERTFYGVSDCEELGVYKNEHLGINATNLYIDGWNWCWLAGEHKDQLPIISGGPCFGGDR